MEEFSLSFREVIPDQTNPQLWKEIVLNTGAAQSTLQDIKVAEKAGGYYYNDASSIYNRNRFIYWRTNSDILELSEISLDLNLVNNNIRFKFTDSPILAVSIAEIDENLVVLAATVSSIHQLKFSSPHRLHKTNDETQSFSVFHEAATHSSRDPSASLFYMIGHAPTPNHPIPHTAACALNEIGKEAYFALAHQNNLILFTMNCFNGQTTMVELKESYIVPRILSNLTGALRGKSSTTDSQYSTSLVFSTIDDAIYLYGLYRDDHIRMWSTRTGQCVSVVNCVPFGNDTRTQGSQNNLLRRAASNVLCAFLCNASGSEFVTIRTESDGNSFTMHRIDLIPAPEFDLIEFDINEQRIWGLWCNSQGEFNVSSFSLLPNNGSNWVTAGLEALPERKIEEGTDPRQAYCAYIFYPGRFQRDVIDRALVMFRRSNMLSDPNAPMAVLKDRVCYAVEQEVQNELKDYDVSDELYIETSFKFWERFYSCCEQYHIKSSQPIGLVVLESIGGVAVVKKNAYSLLRPCELLEHLMLVGENIEMHHLSELSMDEQVKYGDLEDLVKLVSVLSTIEQELSDEDKIEIDTKLYELNIPNVIVSELVSDIVARDNEDNILPRDFLVNINQEVKLISQLPAAMVLLLKMLRMHDGQPAAVLPTFSHITQQSKLLLSIGHLFLSNAGISLVAESLRQISIIRFSLCRNLLILQHILMESSDLQRDTIEIIRSRCMPETVVFVQAYYVMVWICETTEVPPTPAALDASIHRLSILQLSDYRYKHRSSQPTTILEQFLRGRGSRAAISLLVEGAHRDSCDLHWQFTLLPLTTIIGQLLWAVCGNFIFGEWLMGSCQHILIQQYVRLLNSWCEYNICSRHFVAAVSLLDDGEPQKAFDLFMQSSKGIFTEPFLRRVILDAPDDSEPVPNESIAQYYLKVIQLFEQHSALDCIIRLAKAAIDNVEANHPQLAMFQSIVFTSHLNLDHYTEAYHSLIGNAEPSRRKDCLRQLVVCLFEKRRLDLLMKFPYLGLQDELENIIESRARSMAIDGNNYYDFLHAFYISKSNMRKASSIMYEQALRCSLECDTLTAVERRYECLLACITTLHLVDEKYAWIASPLINDDQNVNARVNDDNRDDEQMDTDAEVGVFKRQVTVLELGDIRKELLLTEAIITLAKHRRELSSILHAEADELIAVLSNAGLYTAAIKLAVEFKRNISSVLQSLAFACIRANDEDANETWLWLQENDLAELSLKNSATEMAWKLLESLVDDQEADGSTVLHKVVASKILNLGEFLPHWLYLSYRRRNPTELLRLYVSHGRLIEATDLAKEYILTMMNRGGEYFGLANALHTTLPALCFPVNAVDQLMLNLKLNETEDAEYEECLNDLKQVVETYIETAKQVSKNKIEYLSRSSGNLVK